MAIYDIFLRRDKKQPDVFQYDDLPREFRVQVAHIWHKAIGDNDAVSRYPLVYWRQMAQTLAKELGQFSLVGKEVRTPWDECVQFLMESSTEEALSLIEMSFRHLHAYVRQYSYDPPLQVPDDAIAELNARFKLYGIGYEFIDGSIIRIDSQFLHAESIKPALMLLKARKFKGAEEEFIQAHEHLRKGNHEDALAWALKSFESTMRTICDERKITYDPQKDTAKQLIEKIFASQVIPGYLQSEFGGLRAVLESGLPTLRNKSAAHGQGSNPRTVPEHFARYALHMAASNIVFLVECHKPHSGQTTGPACL